MLRFKNVHQNSKVLIKLKEFLEIFLNSSDLNFPRGKLKTNYLIYLEILQLIRVENLLEIFSVAYPENFTNKCIFYFKMGINNSDSLISIGVNFFELL